MPGLAYYLEKDIIFGKGGTVILTRAATLWCMVKGNVYPRTGHEGPEEEQIYSSTLSLTSTLDGVGG
jgi:hypothetical protein